MPLQLVSTTIRDYLAKLRRNSQIEIPPEREIPLPEIPPHEKAVIIVRIIQTYTRAYKLTGLDTSPRGFRRKTAIAIQSINRVIGTLEDTTYI
jgi:hypothetical protein